MFPGHSPPRFSKERGVLKNALSPWETETYPRALARPRRLAVLA